MPRRRALRGCRAPRCDRGRGTRCRHPASRSPGGSAWSTRPPIRYAPGRRTSSRICVRVLTSAPVVGSSSSTSAGRCSNAIAVCTRRRSPPESCDARRSSNDSRPSAAATSSMRVAASARRIPARPAKKRRLSRTRSVRYTPVSCGRDAELCPHLARRSHRVDPAHLDPAVVGPAEPRDDRDQRGLAGAVGAEQPEDRPRLDSEVDTRQRDGGAVRLPQVLDQERRGTGPPGYAGCEVLGRIQHTERVSLMPISISRAA